MATTMAPSRRGVSCPSRPPLMSNPRPRQSRFRLRLCPWQTAVALIVIIASQSAVVEAACPNVNFLFPTPDQEFRVQDTVVTSYKSTSASSTMGLWCTSKGPPTGPNRKLVQKVAKAYNATVEMNLPENALGERCWFVLQPDNNADCEQNGLKLQSPQFAVAAANGTPQTIGLARNANNIASASAAPEEAGGGGMTVGAQIGIGVGVSIVVGLLVGGLVVWLYLRRQHQNIDDPNHQSRGWGFPKIVWQRPGPEKRHSETPRPLLNRKDSSRTDSANFSVNTRPSAVSSDISYPSTHNASHPASYPSAISNLSTHSYSPPPPQGPVPVDDSFFVGYSENLPGFYGSARGSGSKHDVMGPSQYDPEANAQYHQNPSYQPGSYITYNDHKPHIPGEGMNKTGLHNPSHPPHLSHDTPTITPIEYYPPEKDLGDSAFAATYNPSAAAARPPSELREPDAELPGTELHHGYGPQFELPTQQRPQPYMPGGSAMNGVAGPGPGAAAAMAARREAQEQKFLLDDVELMGLKKKKQMRPPDPKNPDEYL